MSRHILQRGCEQHGKVVRTTAWAQSRLQVRPACRFMLTTTLHWNLQWSILDHLFDRDFHVCPAFLADVPALQRRLRCALPAHHGVTRTVKPQPGISCSGVEALRPLQWQLVRLSALATLCTGPQTTARMLAQSPGRFSRQPRFCQRSWPAWSQPSASSSAPPPPPQHTPGSRALRRRWAVLNLVLAPFVLVFLAMHFFLSNAEKFYHHPSSVGARQWSSLALWRLREFNELPHYVQHRCAHETDCCWPSACCCRMAWLMRLTRDRKAQRSGSCLTAEATLLLPCPAYACGLPAHRVSRAS